MKFNRRFESLYHNLPIEICPSEVVAKVYYALAHHPDLAFYLRERKSSTLEQMFIDVEEIENNLWACGMLPDQIEEDLNAEEQKEEDEHEELDLHISDQQQVNDCETDFCINFLNDFHSEENEFTNYESEQESCYEYIQENFQHNQKQISLSLYLESLNIHQPIYDRYDSEAEFNNEDEKVSKTSSSTIFYVEPVYDEYEDFDEEITRFKEISFSLSYSEIFKDHTYDSDDKQIDYVDFEFYEKEVNILSPASSSFDVHMEEPYFIKKADIVQQQFNLWEQKEEASQNFQDPVEVYLKVFISSNKINSSLFHCECGVQFYDESQIDILLPLIFKDLELNDHKQKLLGDAPVEQSYLISRTEILKKECSLLNKYNSHTNNQVLISYQYEDPLAVFLESSGNESFSSFFHYMYINCMVSFPSLLCCNHYSCFS
jgi:hypothetical protein